MKVAFFSGKRGVKRIVLCVVAVIIAAVIIAGNLVLSYFSPILHSFMYYLFGGTTQIGEEAKNTLNSADSVIREIAEESMVLLKNDEVDGKPFLPRSKDEKFNLFGWASTDAGFLVVGGGSGGTTLTAANPNRVTLTQAFDQANVAYNKELTQKYNNFSSTDADGGSTGADNDRNMINPDANWYTSELMNQAKEYSTTAVVVLSRWGAENGGDGELYNVRSENYHNGELLELTANEEAIFKKLGEYGMKAIVLLNTTNPIESEFLYTYDNVIEACIYVGVPGQSGASAIPNLLIGQKTVNEYFVDDSGNIVPDENGEPIVINSEVVKVNPSGRLSDLYARDWQTNNPVIPNVVPNKGDGKTIGYTEGIYFGYKWYETADHEGYFKNQGMSYEDVVAFPFGYGLSYTTFTQEIVAHSWQQGEKLVPGKEYSVTVQVTNTGNYEGREVVQLYYTAPYTNGGIEKAYVNLLAFDKTAVLKPASESAADSVQEIELTFTAYDMASYDDYDKNSNGFKGYELDPGEYDIKLMQNSHKTIDLLTIDCDGVKFDKDPVTNTEVKNLFTGEDAYANMPIDGSTGVQGGVEYLSRENCFANLEELKLIGTPTADAKKGFTNDVTIPAGTDIQYGQDAGLYLATTADGGKPSADALTGKNAEDAAKLVVNEGLLAQLRDWDDEETWNLFLNQLTQAEIKNLIGMGGFKTVAVESIGKRENDDKDGPAGFNNNVIAPGVDAPEFPVFPVETLSGCSWSARLMRNLGRAQGAVGVSLGFQGWYAPGVNLHRSVYNSRNYEYYSEDGVLSGKLAAQTVMGTKENNVYCYVKHFVISDNGDNACNWYEWLTEQTLRETYLKPFEIAVKEGKANGMMSAFNRLGNIWCGFNQALLTNVLRNEWGFHGTVITDWQQGYMTPYTNAVRAGNDLWLNGSSDTPASDLNFGESATAYAARQSVKGIIYTYVDTYMTAKDYRDKVASGEYEDPFNVQLGIGKINQAEFSPQFVALWVALDVLLILGFGACILFMFIPKEKQAEQQPEPLDESQDKTE